jgi:hypothetical protein
LSGQFKTYTHTRFISCGLIKWFGCGCVVCQAPALPGAPPGKGGGRRPIIAPPTILPLVVDDQQKSNDNAAAPTPLPAPATTTTSSSALTGVGEDNNQSGGLGTF